MNVAYLTKYTPLGYTVNMQPAIKKSLTRRLKIIEGQVRGLQKLVEADTYCIDIITQSSAIRKALSAVEDLTLENHLSTHVIEQMKHGKQKQAIKEILDVYKVSKHK